jgi:hypothetical protein
MDRVRSIVLQTGLSLGDNSVIFNLASADQNLALEISGALSEIDWMLFDLRREIERHPACLQKHPFQLPCAATKHAKSS